MMPPIAKSETSATKMSIMTLVGTKLICEDAQQQSGSSMPVIGSWKPPKSSRSTTAMIGALMYLWHSEAQQGWGARRYERNRI